MPLKLPVFVVHPCLRARRDYSYDFIRLHGFTFLCRLLSSIYLFIHTLYWGQSCGVFGIAQLDGPAPAQFHYVVFLTLLLTARSAPATVQYRYMYEYIYF